MVNSPPRSEAEPSRRVLRLISKHITNSARGNRIHTVTQTPEFRDFFEERRRKHGKHRWKTDKIGCGPGLRKERAV